MKGGKFGENGCESATQIQTFLTSELNAGKSSLSSAANTSFGDVDWVRYTVSNLANKTKNLPR